MKKTQTKKYGLAYVTASSMKEAGVLARACLTQKVAACANIYPSVLSIYEWNKKHVEEKEVLVILKTREDLFSPLCTLIKKHHSYQKPCIVFVPVLKGEKGFLSWWKGQLKS